MPQAGLEEGEAKAWETILGVGVQESRCVVGREEGMGVMGSRRKIILKKEFPRPGRDYLSHLTGDEDVKGG